MTSESGNKKRVVFSLRTLFFLLIAIAIPLGLYARWASSANVQANVVKLLKKAGLQSISYDPPGAEKTGIYYSWLQYTTNPNRIDYFYSVKKINGTVDETDTDAGEVSEAFKQTFQFGEFAFEFVQEIECCQAELYNSLKTLSFSPPTVNNEMIRRLAEFKQLSWLELRAHENQSAATLNWEPISLLERMNLLSIENLFVGSAGAEALSKLQLITDLSLYNCEIGDKGAACIARLRKLRSLRLSSNKIGNEGAKAIGSLLEIKELTLSDNSIGSTGLDGWSGLTKLERFYASNNSIDDDGLRTLSQLPQLKDLYLLGNPIQGIGFVGFPKLESISIDGSNLSKEGWHALARLDVLKELRVVGRSESMYPVHLLEGGFPALATLALKPWNDG